MRLHKGKGAVFKRDCEQFIIQGNTRKLRDLSNRSLVICLHVFEAKQQYIFILAARPPAGKMPEISRVFGAG